jgi:hypothetical protein
VVQVVFLASLTEAAFRYFVLALPIPVGLTSAQHGRIGWLGAVPWCQGVAGVRLGGYGADHCALFDGSNVDG